VVGWQRRARTARHLEACDTQEKRIFLKEPNFSAATIIAILEQGYLATVANPCAGLGSVMTSFQTSRRNLIPPSRKRGGGSSTSESLL